MAALALNTERRLRCCQSRAPAHFFLSSPHDIPLTRLPTCRPPSFHFLQDSIYLSLYISLTHFPEHPSLAPSIFHSPPPASHLRFHRCRSSSEAITLLPFSLYLHDTQALWRQMRATGGRLFRQNAADLISSRCFSAATPELGGRTNSRRVIALSLCKYHGPSLIFILLPLLPTKDPQCGPISSGLGGRLVSYHPPLPGAKRRH